MHEDVKRPEFSRISAQFNEKRRVAVAVLRYLAPISVDLSVPFFFSHILPVLEYGATQTLSVQSLTSTPPEPSHRLHRPLLLLEAGYFLLMPYLYQHPSQL